MSDRFASWVSTADAVRGTAKKLEKLRFLGDYLSGLADDGDLARATRLFAGAPFPRTDERVLSVGGAALVAAILARSGARAADVGTSYQEHADLGDVAAALIGVGPAPAAAPLRLVDVTTAFDAIAGARGSAAKQVELAALLDRADGPQARYLVKIMTGEPRIGLREGLLEDAIARAFGRPREAVGRAHMLGGDIGIAAVQARGDRLADARFVHFAPIGMMLATPVLDLAEVEHRFPAPYVVEDKYDGVRAQVHKDGDRVELYSRTFDRVTGRFPELLGALAAIPGSVVLDAEILSFDDAGRAIPFVRFQRRLGRKVADDAIRAALPASLVVFDILERDGVPLLDLPLVERAARLADLPLSPPLRLARSRSIAATGPALVAALDAEFTAARARGNEGLMVKDPHSPYRPGRRGMEWLKVKRALRTLDVVVTAVEWGHGKRRGVLSDYTFAVRDGTALRNIGKAYSGLTDREIAEGTEHFKARTIGQSGRSLVVTPDTVIEVAFDAVQPSARHDSGYALRFPRIVRLRPDKPVTEIDTLETVRRIAEPDTDRG
ncbi:MAG TPA: ATP-dependent DNA ligase [Candidatus Limnocylindria bacterium]